MSERSFAVFFIGHASNDDHAGWLQQRLAYARVDLGGLRVGADQRGMAGTWGRMPCRARHLDDTDLGPLLLTFNPKDFEAALELPPMDDFELPPPLAAFAEACESLSPHMALLVSAPLSDTDIDQYAVDLEAEVTEGVSAEVCERPYTALFLSNFNIVMLESEQPLLTEMSSVRVAGGAVYFSARNPGPETPCT